MKPNKTHFHCCFFVFSTLLEVQIRTGKDQKRTLRGNKVRERAGMVIGEESGAGMRQTRDSKLNKQ